MILGATFRAFALDEAIRQKHLFFRVEELFDRLDFDQLIAPQRPINVLRQLVVLDPVGRMPVVESDMEAVEIGFAPGRNVGNELLRRLADFFSGNHDRRAMGIVGADEMHLLPKHALEAHPDVSLGVLHDVANMEIGVGVG